MQPAGEVLSRTCELLGIKEDDVRRRRRGTMDRAIAARMLLKHAWMNQREIARALCLRTGSAVSYQLLKLERELVSDRKLKSTLARVEEALHAS